MMYHFTAMPSLALLKLVSCLNLSRDKKFLLYFDSISCTFESSDICGYTQSRLDNFDWTRNSGETSTSSTGPLYDHTLGRNRRGHYMYAEASQKRTNDVARLTSPLTSRNDGSYSIGFYYHMYGSDTGTLNVYITDGRGNLVNPDFTVSGNQGKSWFQGCVEVVDPVLFSVVFEAVEGTGSRGDIAIDDVTLNTGTCQTNGMAKSNNNGTVNKSISCDFETKDLCGYSQDRNDNFDWSRHTGSTSTSYTGPNHDHTLGQNQKGHFMYIESSFPQSFSDRSRLESPTAKTGNQNHSVEFYYSMNGYSTGDLRVYVDIGHGLNKPSFKISGDKGQKWHFACVDIPPNTSFKIIFEGTVGFSDHGDIAIDDVTYQIGTCSGRALSIGTLPSLAPAIYNSLSCNFDISACSYSQDATADILWMRHAGSTITADTGPSKDHTTPLGSGYYLYVESSAPAESGDKARVHSPFVSLTAGHYSVSFWYHMYGVDIGKLNVYVEEKTGYSNNVNQGSNQNYYNNQRYQSNQGSQHYYGNYHQRPDFTVKGNQSDIWKQGCLDITEKAGTFRLVFEAVRGDSFHGDIAIDDIEVMPYTCAMAKQIVKSTAYPTAVSTSAITNTFKPTIMSSSITSSPYPQTAIPTSTPTSSQLSGIWARWNQTECPITCGEGTTVGTRAITKRDHTPPPAPSHKKGTWSRWYNTECSATCGEGTTVRIRQCSTGHIEDCAGNSTEIVKCNAKPCQVGSWSAWYNVECPVTCGHGTSVRIRQCSSGHVEDCVGNSTEQVTCTKSPCPLGPQTDQHCLSSPCKNGATCEELPGTFNCFCPRGFVGLTCGDDFDECIYSHTCNNKGSCINSNGNFTCVCQTGFTGHDCSITAG